MERSVASNTLASPESACSILPPSAVWNAPADICSIATLPKTADGPIMTSSNSLAPRNHKRAGTEPSQPEEEPHQNTGSGTSYGKHVAHAALTILAFVTVHEGQRLYFKHGNREIRDAEERADVEKKEKEKERLAASQDATVEEEENGEEDQ